MGIALADPSEHLAWNSFQNSFQDFPAVHADWIGGGMQWDEDIENDDDVLPPGPSDEPFDAMEAQAQADGDYMYNA